jgi:hypothetical protein
MSEIDAILSRYPFTRCLSCRHREWNCKCKEKT